MRKISYHRYGDSTFTAKKYGNMAKNKFIEKLTSPLVVLNLLALALFAVALWFGSQAWMDKFTHHGEGIEVPDLIGQKVTDAQEGLISLELQGLVVDSVYDKHKPAGIVLDQKPEAGATVKSGRQIYLTINKSAMDKQPLPSIIGNCTAHQAREILVKNGFIVSNTEYIYGEKDMLLGVKSNGMSIRNGQYISPDTPLTLVVGNNMTESNENSEDYDDINAEEDDVWEAW